MDSQSGTFLDGEDTVRHQEVIANPFLMLIQPDLILQAVGRSQRLEGLKRRVCRPLDRPLIPKVGQAALNAYDAAIDSELEMSQHSLR